MLTTLANNLISTEKLAILMALPIWVVSQFVSPQIDTGFGTLEAVEQPSLVSNVELSFQKDLSLNQATYSLNRFLGAQNTTAKYQVKKYTLEYQLELENDQKISIESEVFMPQVSDSGLPLIVYAPGTTGLQDHCAPTRESDSAPRLGNYENQMIAMASQGYLVLMPNYIGLDDPNLIQPYFHKASEAKVLLNSAEALLSIKDFEGQISDTVFFGGYSQGGHAAFAAADFYDPREFEFKFGGVFGHGPTTNTRDLLWNNPNLAPYFAKAFETMYDDFDPALMFLENRLFQVDRSVDLCVHQAFAFNSASVASTYNNNFANVLKTNNFSDEKFSSIGNRLAENHAGTDYKQIPSLILQGTGDPIVTAENQADFVQSLCQREVPVEFKTYPRVHHFQTRQVSFWDTLEWVDRVNAGEVDRSGCL